MEAQQPPRCPSCSFLVFNRRYRKCESCGAELPAGLLYSEAELEAIRKSELEQLEHEMERQREASKEATAAAQRAALATIVVISN
jgi:hypothetical protein